MHFSNLMNKSLLSIVLICIVTFIISSLALSFNLSFPYRDILSIFTELKGHNILLKATFLSFSTGVWVSLLSLVMSFCFVGYYFIRQKSLILSIIPSLVIPIPHISLAILFTLLLSDYGYFSNLLRHFNSPLTELGLIRDTNTLGLMIILILKETAFLIWILSSNLGNEDFRKHIVIANTLGYSKTQSWFKVVVPQLYSKIRPAFLIVIIYSICVVDVALIVAPTNPGTLAMLIHQYFNQAQGQYLYFSQIMVWLLMFLVFGSLVLYFLLEKISHIFFYHYVLIQRSDGKIWDIALLFFQKSYWGFLFLYLIGFALLVFWSFSEAWFGTLFPDIISFAPWLNNGQYIYSNVINSLVIAFSANLIAFVVVVFYLENLKFIPKKFAQVLEFVFYIPIIVPQMIFILGLYHWFLLIDLYGNWLGVILVQSIFILPYVYLILKQNYQQFDVRYEIVAKSLGKNFWSYFFQVKLALMSKNILYALMIGFSVSFSLYLPTIYIGGGRITNLTTEAMNLIFSSNNSVSSIFSILLMSLPLLIFAIGLLIQKIILPHKDYE